MALYISYNHNLLTWHLDLIISLSGDLPGDFLYSACRLMLVSRGDLGKAELNDMLIN